MEFPCDLLYEIWYGENRMILWLLVLMQYQCDRQDGCMKTLLIAMLCYGA